MTNGQILKLLDILAAAGSNRDKDKEVWNTAQREFPRIFSTIKNTPKKN